MSTAESDIGADTFRKVLGYYPTGVSVVTGHIAGDGPVGLVVGTFTSLSLEPALVSFMPAKSSSSWPKIQSSGAFCVNVLGVDQAEVCRQFSMRGGRKFEGVEWRPGATGSPILSGSVAWVDCRIEQAFDTGDHQIVVGRVVDLRVESDELPMTFLRGGYAQLQLPELPATPATKEDGREQVSAKLAAEVAALLGLDAFESKAWIETREQVVTRLIIGYLEVFLDRLDEALDVEMSPQQQLETLLMVTLNSMRDHAAAAILFQSERSGLTLGSSSRIRDLEANYRGRWIDAIEQGASAGQFAIDIDPRMAQQFMCDAIYSTARWFRDGGRLTRHDLDEMYTKFAVKVVAR